MLFLKPDGRIDLDHRAYFLRGTPGQSIVVAAAEDGYFSILSSDLKDVRSCRHTSKIRAISPHPLDRQLAFVDGKSGSLIVQSLEGERLLEIAPPQVQEFTSNLMRQGFDDCHFDDSGKFLWLAALLSAEECEIQMIDSETEALVAKTTIEDPFGGSSCSFQRTERPDLVSLWLAAGQDGQQVYWLKKDHDGFCCTLETALANTIPPVFSPSGSSFLIVNETGAICKFDFSTMKMIGSPVEHEDEDNPFVESLVFLNERQALAGTNDSRIFVVDTDRMKIEEEVSLEGHEPRPIGVYYPNLANEPGLATDISWFTKMGNFIVFIYRRDRGKGLTGWKDTLLWLSVNGQE